MSALALFGCAAPEAEAEPSGSVDAEQQAAPQSGLDVLAARFAGGSKMAGGIDLTKKRIALVVNHTAKTSANGTHAIDVFRGAGLNVVKAFGPEHGVRGEAPAGAAVGDQRDPTTGVPVISLYGAKKKPTPADLADVDVLFFDVQDIGARFYTYVSTLGYVLEAAAENGKPVLVLDRANPIGPRADGNVLEQPTGFVGMFKIPVQHGMTVGELAFAMRGERWIAKADALKVDVVKVQGWSRASAPTPALLPTRPSPNIRSHNAALLYPGTCLLEGSNVSEGRGTDQPFATIGAPWLTGNLDVLARTLAANASPMVPEGAVRIEPWEGTPTTSKYAGEKIRGLRFTVMNPQAFRPVPFGVAILTTINQLYRANLQWVDGTQKVDRAHWDPQAAWLRALWGDDTLRDAIQRPAGELPRAARDLAAAWAPEVSRFEPLRSKYLAAEYR